jgi:hypothetical protein
MITRLFPVKISKLVFAALWQDLHLRSAKTLILLKLLRNSTSFSPPNTASQPRATGSAKAGAILADWGHWKSRFKLLVPPSELATVGLAQRQAVAA